MRLKKFPEKLEEKVNELKERWMFGYDHETCMLKLAKESGEFGYAEGRKDQREADQKSPLAEKLFAVERELTKERERAEGLAEALDGIDSIVLGAKLAKHINVEAARAIEKRVAEALQTYEGSGG